MEVYRFSLQEKDDPVDADMQMDKEVMSLLPLAKPF